MAESGILVAARAALSVWDIPTAIAMTAIAGAESGWNPGAGGDSPQILTDLGYYESADQAQSWNCPAGSYQGYASWGLWQIFMPVHRAMLVSLGAPNNPCGMADWLRVPGNNARAASRVLQGQGFTAWSVYKWDLYQKHVTNAGSAVYGLVAGGVVPPPEGSYPDDMPTAPGNNRLFWVGAGMLATALTLRHRRR